MGRIVGDIGGGILPAPACDLLDRFTRELGVSFTLTDLNGTVVASTADELAGSVDEGVLAVLEESAGAAAPSGTVRQGERALAPVRLAGRTSGVLVVHRADETGPELPGVVATALGMALDFAEAASSLGRENVNPGWLLFSLLRGSRAEAQRATVVAAIYGWNLFVQRVAVAVSIRGGPRGGEDPTAVLEALLGPAAATTPFGQVDESQWVALPEYEPGQSWSRIRRFAEEVQRRLAPAAPAVTIGIGEPHLPINRVAAVRRSYREAAYAARLGARLRGPGGVYELRLLGPAAFFAPSSPSRRNLAQVVLAPLRDHPALIDTLRAYLTYDLSVATTAARLQVHRHTVRNHLERVFALTGLDPRSLEGAVQLKLALLVVTSDPDVLDPVPEVTP
ncbi:MAG TPA: helix-turn-helix domain-containing protein [Longimicrobium sp.]|nr:helix-turn-helix domain-containing protein [Longimicrobium sp.]